MSKRKTWGKYTATLLVGLLIGIGVPVPIATTAGPAINGAVWDLAEDEPEQSEGKSLTDLIETE